MTSWTAEFYEDSRTPDMGAAESENPVTGHGFRGVS